MSPRVRDRLAPPALLAALVGLVIAAAAVGFSCGPPAAPGPTGGRADPALDLPDGDLDEPETSGERGSQDEEEGEARARAGEVLGFDAGPTMPDNCEDDDDCDNGRFCDGEERCVDGACVAGDPPDCAGETPRCSDEHQACVCTNDSCDDGVFCNGLERCGPRGRCVPGPEARCPASSPVCDDYAATCVCTPASCPPGTVCDGISCI